MGLAFYFYFLFFIIIYIYFFFFKKQFSLTARPENSHDRGFSIVVRLQWSWMICQREKDMTTSIKIVTKMPSKYLPKKKKSPKKLKQKKHKMKIKIRLELYSKNCFAQYIWRHIFFLNGFWKLFVEQLQYVWKLPHFVLKTKNCS